MPNRDLSETWAYHNATRHSWTSVRSGGHHLDWANQPVLFKSYPDLPPIALPQAPTPGRSLDLDTLAHLLRYSAGILKPPFRAAACTGALYEIELYVVCGALPGLAAGVYHFHPGDFALRRLREGDFRGLEPAAARAQVIIVSTGTYWRNAWKYQERTYRHFGWDNGTMLANLLAVAAALDIPARLLCGFVDAEINRLLGLDTAREVSLSLVALGQAEADAPAPPEVPELRLRTLPPSRNEVDYPAMRRMHAASSLESPEEVKAWRAPIAPARFVPFANAVEVIQRRGSSRRFRREAITQEQFASILDLATRGVAADFGGPLNELYLIVHAVDGLRSGAYFAKAGTLELLKPGDFREPAAYLALEQRLAGDAAAAIFFLADLQESLERFGNRGYRAVQLEAGIRGGRIYLGAYAQHLGATGLTFYDEDVTQFFSPHAVGKSAIFLAAVGHPARRQAE